MMSKNNQQVMIQKNSSTKQRFALRKMTIGVASVLVGLTFMGMNVSADQVSGQNDSAQHVNVQSPSTVTTTYEPAKQNDQSTPQPVAPTYTYEYTPAYRITVNRPDSATPVTLTDSKTISVTSHQSSFQGPDASYTFDKVQLPDFDGYQCKVQSEFAGIKAPEATIIKDNAGTYLQIPAIPYPGYTYAYSVNYVPIEQPEYVQEELHVYGPANDRDNADSALHDGQANYWKTLDRIEMAKDADGNWVPVTIGSKNLNELLHDNDFIASADGHAGYSLPTDWFSQGYVPVITHVITAQTNAKSDVDDLFGQLNGWQKRNKMSGKLPDVTTRYPITISFNVHFVKPIEYKQSDQDDEMNYYPTRTINLHNTEDADVIDKTVEQRVHIMRQSINGHAGYYNEYGVASWNPWVLDPATPEWSEYSIPQKSGYKSQIDESTDSDRSDLVDATTVDALPVGDVNKWTSQYHPLKIDEDGNYPAGYYSPSDVDVYYAAIPDSTTNSDDTHKTDVTPAHKDDTPNGHKDNNTSEEKLTAVVNNNHDNNAANKLPQTGNTSGSAVVGLSLTGLAALLGLSGYKKRRQN